MTQYCRYCAHLICGDVAYCREKKMCISDTYAKRPNKCSKFDFNEIDAFGENPNPYRPRPEKQEEGEQIRMAIT